MSWRKPCFYLGDKSSVFFKRALSWAGCPLLPFPTLLHYFPLAGELTYLLYSGNVVIDCSPAANGPGVAFLEAEAEGDLGFLANSEVHDHSAFLRLVPELDVRELPAPLFAVQVTRFCGPQGVDSVAVGFAAHTAVVDGRALWRFVEAWTAECRGDADLPPPTIERAVIGRPRSQGILASGGALRRR
ncbi:malonyl-CoA:anthocyanidin 5-O-glucoside-6''-O-malonyltransferase-like [Musa acuminata AAA Group]|uniref:malonyl-CoA:anthocyanidin 5-O-glucoside-6''-O-malonyltransferase-like n=1 Tax=Musa acuminata AAA Group TaxID=214697 RepID=UPI0031D23656